MNKIVILSTHIVEDVYNLCSNMAIMDKGAVKLVDRPLDAIDKLKGKVWHSFIDKNDLDKYKKEFDVLSTRLVEGKFQINVLSNVKPSSTFEVTAPNLEDVYFTNVNK